MSTSLFSEIQIGGKTIKNRVAMAPLTRSRATPDGVPTHLLPIYYKQRSSAGLIVSEATNISDQARGFINAPGIYTEEMVEAWKPVTKAVHDAGSVIWLQLWHTGRASHSEFHSDKSLPVAPSAIKIENPPDVRTPVGKRPREVPHALTEDEIKEVVQNYRQAAINAMEAGFDGVEIHSANGYLPDSFLQSASNHRTDKYGGSFENRFRFLREILEAITEVVPSNQVAVRLSPNGSFNGMGSPDFRESFSYFIQQLDSYKLGYLHVMDGLAFGFHNLGPQFTLKDVRKVYSGVVMGNCGYTQEAAEQAIDSGDADLIAFGRPWISNPDLVERFQINYPLADPAPIEALYSHDLEGYIDFPRASL